MLLFMMWSILLLLTLTGAGYSHYLYRVKHNEYYERLYAKDRTVDSVAERDPRGFYSLPIVALLIAYFLVSIFLML